MKMNPALLQLPLGSYAQVHLHTTLQEEKAYIELAVKSLLYCEVNGVSYID